MDSRHDRMGMDAEGDRLSVLSDDLIHKILSFVGLKDAIGTSVLSSRWRFAWTSIPHLSFSSEDFSTMDKFYDFVTQLLSRRNNHIQLSSFKLYLCGKDGQDVAQRIVNYAFSLNVQEMNITCLCGNNTSLFEKNTGFPLSLSSSETLKHLTLKRTFGYDHIILTSTGEFSSLTTLHLCSITLYDGLFSMCPNLENLTLNCCKMPGSEVLKICHPRLSNLTLGNENLSVLAVIVVTPQLKSLTISKYFGDYQIFAPELASLLFSGHCPFIFSTDGFPSLEKAQLSLHTVGVLTSSDASTIISLLQMFHNVKVLSLSMEIIKLLNSFVELIAHQPSPLANLRSLKILPKIFCLLKHQHMRVTMSTEVKNYLLSGSSKATLTEVLREQCCDRAADATQDSI